MRRLAALLLVAGLLFASTAAVADQERGRGRAPPFAGGGAFQVQSASQSVTGEHVSFNYSEAGISDFAAGGLTLFDLTVTGADEDEDDDEDDGDGDEGRARGPTSPRANAGELRVRMDNFSFTAHDTPTAASRLRTDGVVRVSFEEGVVLAREGDESVRFSFGAVTGVVRGDDVSIDGRAVTLSDGALLVLDAPRGPFGHHRDLGRAIARGHIGAEATLNRDENDSVVDQVVSYGNVTMTTLKAERGNVTVLIDGHGFEGRVIVLNVDGRVLGADSADKLDVQIDNASVRPASNLSDILDPDDDGYHPEYYIVFDPNAQAFQLIATLPHYSVHVLSVTTLVELVKPSVLIGTLAGVALLVPAALLLFRRR